MTPQRPLSNVRVIPWQLPPLGGDTHAPDLPLVTREPLERPIAAADEALDYRDLVETPEPPLKPMPVLQEAYLDPNDAAAAAEGYAEGLQRGIADGTAQGYATGFEEGKRQAEQHIAVQAHNVAAIAARLGAPIAALDRVIEEAVVALALEVARHVIGSEVSRSRDYLVRLIREAIAKVPIEMGAPSVLLNPADRSLISDLAPEIEDDGIVLLDDDSIEPGGCVVIANGDDAPLKDRRWHPRASEGVSQVNLTLASRWRSVMLTLFDGEEL
jgi:flagellar assembly protein FliH